MKAVVIAVFVFLLFIGICILTTQSQIKLDNAREDFCQSKDMNYRLKSCGLQCSEHQCFGEDGEFEMELVNNHYVLIGYDEKKFVNSGDDEE